MIELFGNSIWNNNTPNTDKKVIIADEKELKKIEQSINNAGFNYCAYIRKGNAYIAVNKNDVENIHKLNINIKAVSNSNNKPYKPNKIIGNTPFKNINNKYYQKYSADIAYAVAYRLDELNIPFSGKLYDVYNSVTITIDKAYVEQIQSIAKEITEQRSLIANSNGKITNAIKDAVKKLNYSEEQLKSINKAENLLLDRIDDENLLSAFDAMFEGTNKYSADDIAKLSDEFVKIFENLHGLECVFASRNDFNGLKKEFDKNILFEKYTQDKGFSSEQEKVIKNMIDKNMDSVLDILDFTFSVSEMEDMYLAYQQGDYDRLINIVASVKDTSRIEIEGEIESGTYTPVLPNYDTLDRDLFFNNPDTERITHIYFNPDSVSGGQFVISDINYDQIVSAVEKYSNDPEAFFDYLDSVSNQTLADVGSDYFRDTYEEFYSNEHIAEGFSKEVIEQLTNIATVNYTVPDKTDYYKSYSEIQSENPDAIILFRVGDFYEVLGDNAQEAAEALNLTLMSRTINGEKIPMVGFPSSYLEINENLLVENGHKILTVEPEDIAERASLRNKAQEVAKRNNLPFSDKFSMGAEDDFDTAVYDGSMSADDYEKLQQAEIEPKADRPTITCDWSEHPAFEDGKTYSVADFDRIMKSADDEWVEQRQLEIEEYGSENAVAEAYRNGELDDVHLGYAKTKFIINMPNGTQYTERQDIGDGIGGVIDFLKQYPQYSGVVKVLEADIEFDKNDGKSVGLVETKEIYNATETKGIDVENTETQYFAEINNLQKGDVIYIDETEFAVETIGNFDIQLRDLSSSFPAFRAESKENLNRLLASKTAYFPAKTQDENEVTQNIETEQPTLFDFDNGDTLFSDAAHTTVEKGKNYVMEDRETVTGAKTKFKNNITAIRILKTLESENRKATVAEQRQLSLYTGWGGLANAFEPDSDKWKNEYLELKNLLTDDEYTAARSSVLDAFYTDSTIIDSIYKVIQNAGLESGNILEPAMGIGNFFGRLPADLRGKVNLYGVEKDSLSGRIAQKLYPQANITIDGFENTHFNDNSFDVAIGNIPFGDFGVNDKKYNSQNLKIHDYFFLKSLDKVRDGGIIAFVTSKGTLDKKDSSFRRELANRADLVGAIRLPNNAFKSAGTEVTSDIIFLKKRSEPPIVEPTWVSIGQTADGLPVNNYFVKHPEMVLGEIVEGNKMYGRTDDTMCVPFDDGRTLSDLLAIAVNNISFTYTPHKDKLIPLAEKSDEIILPQGIRAESYFKSNNDIYFYGSNNESELITIPCSELLDKKYTAKNISRISKYIQLRDTLRELLDVQQYESNDDKVVQLQEKLNTLYDDYYIRYGLLHNNYNRNILGFDGAYQLVASLEKSYDKSKLIEKSDIFTQRVNVPKTAIEHIDTASEALAISIAEKGIIDFAYMSSLTDIPEENLRINLCANGEIFAVPELSNKDNIVYQTASEYLSGDIYAKLDMAKLSARDNDIYRANITALEEAIPEPLKAADIDVNIGATWISPKYYEQFMYELFKTPKENRSDYEPKHYWQRNGKKIEVEYSEFSGRWNIKNKSIDKSVTATKTYGAHGYTAYAIFQSVLNLTEPKVYKIKVDEFGRPIFDKNHKPISELDVPATQVVQQKANAIRREFKNWIFKDADRRKDILDTYNRTFNCIKPRQYDGSHLTFPGMNSNIELHEHQKNAIAHAIFGGNTLFAHSVGAGKTFEMIATAMECKRLGLCHKSLFAVPNHLTEQVGDDFLKLYPNANILVATKDDFKSENRKKLMSKIATGNYDAVIIGHTQLKMLPLSPERQQAIYQEQIDNIIKGIAELKAQDGSNFKIKDMERTKKSLEKQLTKLQSAKKDNSIYFEELGIDKLFIDEAHEFKNLFCTTKLQNVSGISSRASQRATELFAKCRYLDDKTGGKGVVFATGTPISNSVTELHTMMRYLNYDFLASHNNMQNFDNWVSTFGVQKKEYELAPAGNKFKERTRIAEYSNLPELMSMFKLIADVRTSDTLNLNVPKCEMHIVDVEPTELQEELVNELSDRADEVNNGSVDPSQDNMLKITGDGRKLGLDPRLIDAEFEDNPGTKLNVCVNNVFDIYEKTTDKKLTQIIFCDLGVPGKGVNVDADSKDEDTKSVTEIDSLEESGKFCVYDDIKDKLIAKGVSSQEIAFIHDAKNEKQKSELFAKVRSGEVRILLGSTGKMGTGTNVQDRIIALHDLDVPWRPSDLEQRRGRMVRQGNINEKVHLYRYVTKGTFDAYSYQLLEKKQKFISQIMTSKAPARKCSDVDQASLSYSEIKALCTGDERIREKLTLENRVKELTAYKSEYDNTRYELEDKVNAYPEQRKDLLCTIGNIQKDIDKLNALPKDDEGSIVYTYNFGDAAYTNSEEDRKSAAKALGAFVALSRQHRNETIKVGDISGYEVEIINKGLIVDDITARLGNGKYKVNFGSLNIHNLSKLENLFTKFNEFLSNAKKELNRIDYDYNSAKEMLTKPFEFEQELTEKTQRLADLTTALNIELAQRQNTLTEKECKTRYFSKNSILHKGKSSVISDQNSLEVKRSAPEL